MNIPIKGWNEGRAMTPPQGSERCVLSERFRPYAVTERANSKTPAWLATGGPAHFGSVSDRTGATLPSELLWSARKASGE